MKVGVVVKELKAKTPTRLVTILYVVSPLPTQILVILNVLQNYEISLSYQALPGQQKKLRHHNMHLMLEFFVGAFDWFKIPVPIYAIVEGFVATARLRVQFVQQPPFVRNLTVTLMGVPKVIIVILDTTVFY